MANPAAEALAVLLDQAEDTGVYDFALRKRILALIPTLRIASKWEETPEIAVFTRRALGAVSHERLVAVWHRGGEHPHRWGSRVMGKEIQTRGTVREAMEYADAALEAEGWLLDGTVEESVLRLRLEGLR